MKTIKRKAVIVVFMFVTLINYSKNTNDFNTTIDTKKVKVEFINVNKGHQLTIKSNDGVLLHSEIVSKKGKLTKFFDLSALKDGNYSIELNKDYEILVKPFKVKTGNVIFNKELEKVIFKPVIRNNKNIVLFSKNNFDKEPIKISLYYNDNPIYSATLQSDDAIIKRAYKLDEKIKGNYSVIIYNNGRNYVYDFKI